MCTKVLAVNIKPPPLMLLLREIPTELQRAVSKLRKQNLLYTKGPAEMSGKHANCQPQPHVPFLAPGRPQA